MKECEGVKHEGKVTVTLNMAIIMDKRFGQHSGGINFPF